MGVFSGPEVNENGLVLALDAASPKNYDLTAVEVLVVAGGGGGGTHHGGGGGGGGVIYNQNFAVTPGAALTVTVGDGGAGRVGGTNSPGGSAGNGGNSVFGALTAIGGGGGGNYPSGGANGGSGGGSNNWSTSTAGGTGTAGQGFAGGSNNGQQNYGGGGGGAGGTAKGLSNNSGGDGLPFAISGTETYYGGGGAAGVYPGYANATSYGYGGLGGGGNGGNGPHGSGTSPTAGGTNTGGGGGGVADLSQSGAAGGSGIVIVRYPGPQKAIGGTVTSNNGYTIHTFTSVGSTTFTPLVATNNSAISGLSDFSGRGNFGTSVNGPTYSSANGGSIVFDGTNDCILVNNNASILSSTSYTKIAWFYPTSFATNNNIISGGNSGQHAFWLAGANKLNAGHNGSWSTVISSTTLSLNTWYCGAVTFNTTSGWILYLNGVQEATNASTTTFTGNGEILIGAYGTGANVFTGRVSNTLIYNRVLTAAEIQQNFNALRGRYGI